MNVVNNLKDLFGNNENYIEYLIAELMLTRPIKSLLRQNLEDKEKLAHRCCL